MKVVVAIALVVVGLARWWAGAPAAACSYATTPAPASVADAVLRSDVVVIGDLFAPPGPLDFLDTIRIGQPIVPAAAAGDTVHVFLESPCGDRLRHIEPGRYLAFLRESTTIAGHPVFPKLQATLVPIENGVVAAQSLAGVARELNGMSEAEATAYVAGAASLVSPGAVLPAAVGEPTRVFRTPAVITPRALRRNSDLRGMLARNGAVLVGEVVASQPLLASDGAHPERLVTRHRVRVLGWIKHPKRFEPGPWLVVDQPGARFGEALFESDGDPLMQPGERYLFILQNLSPPTTGAPAGTLVAGLRLRIDDTGRTVPVAPGWLRYGGIRELAGLPLLVAVMRIGGVVASGPGQ